jgi:hypothetical protein
MANGGGNFGGDGSVKWEVITKKPKKGGPAKNDDNIDDDYDTYFVVLLKPHEGTLIDMIKHEGHDRMRIRVPIADDISKQIEIHWNKGFPGTEKVFGTGT